MKLQRGNSLAGLLVTIAIIALLAVVFLKGGNIFGVNKSPRADGRGTSVPGLAMARAEDMQCKSNLGQIRASLMIAKSDNDEQWPENLEATRLGSAFYTCPMGKGKYPYTYNQTTGDVHCPYPGHEKY